MANLQVRNVPDALHERLRRHARARNWEWRERLASRAPVDLGADAATLLVAERIAEH